MKKKKENKENYLDRLKGETRLETYYLRKEYRYQVGLIKGMNFQEVGCRVEIFLKQNLFIQKAAPGILLSVFSLAELVQLLKISSRLNEVKKMSRIETAGFVLIHALSGRIVSKIKTNQNTVEYLPVEHSEKRIKISYTTRDVESLIVTNKQKTVKIHRNQIRKIWGYYNVYGKIRWLSRIFS